METYERVKELRKNFLKMSQTAFGQRLGVSRDVIKNIELNALAKPEQKLSLLKLICKEFSVSEEWLLNGNGEMFASNEAEYGALIDQIMTGENEFAKNIFKTFALFEEEDWEALRKMIEKYLTVSDTESVPAYDDVPDTPEELEKQFPPVQDRSDVG
jgi:DNA-binding XRE family transcriptional regulator